MLVDDASGSDTTCDASRSKFLIYGIAIIIVVVVALVAVGALVTICRRARTGEEVVSNVRTRKKRIGTVYHY